MIISEVIKNLEKVKEMHGDIEVTCTATTLNDGYTESGSKFLPDVYESTVENFKVGLMPVFGGDIKRVRLYF